MAQKDLKDKIKRIWIWTIVGIIVFLIISFFLKSSYPITHYKFNLSDAYDVLKDALTLAAAFLAPVAAFVLFNDWRVEHRLKINEDLSKAVIKETQYLISETFNVFWKLLNINFLNKQNLESYISLVAELNEKANEIKISLKEFYNLDLDDEFIKSIEQILKIMEEVSSDFYTALMSFEKRQITCYGDFSIEFGRYYDQVHMKLDLVKQHLESSKILAKKFKV